MPPVLVVAMAVCSQAAWGQVANVRGRVGNTEAAIGTVESDPAEELRRQGEACDRKIAEARELVSAGRWGLARMKLDSGKSLIVNEGQHQSMRSLYTRIDEEGQRQLAEARESYAKKDYAVALSEMRKISNVFGQLPSGLAARAALDRAETDEEAQAAVQEPRAAKLDEAVSEIISQAARRGRRQAATASMPATGPASMPADTERFGRIKRLPVDKQAQVVTLLERIAKAYPLCPTGQRAAADLELIHADAALAAALAGHEQDRRASAALQVADMLRASGMVAKARDGYLEVIRKYPDSPHARTARAALKAIGGAGE
jgi:hypothetical protein